VCAPIFSVWVREDPALRKLCSDVLDAARDGVSLPFHFLTYFLTYLLGQGAADRALRRHNGTTSEACAHALAAAAHTRPARERARLRRALSHGFSPPEAMLAAAPRGEVG